MAMWPFMIKQRVLIFGAGSGGVLFFKRNRRRYKIIGFLDNGKGKWGSLVHGVPIYAPEDISLLAYEKIIIASDYYREIYDQLINDVGIDKNKIEFFFNCQFTHHGWYAYVYKHTGFFLMELICKDIFIVSRLLYGLYKVFSGETLSRIAIRWLDEQHDNKVCSFRHAEPSMAHGPKFIHGQYRKEQILLPDISLYRFSDVEVKSVSRALKLSSDEIILERVATAKTKNADYRSSRVAYHGHVYALVRDEKAIDIPAGILINGFSETNYYHLVLEVISQLQFVKEIPDLFSEYPILLPSHCKKIPAISQFIDSILSGKNIIYLHTTECYRVYDLLYINMPNGIVPNLKVNAKYDVSNSFVRRESLKYLRDAAYALCADGKKIDSPKRIFLGRKPGLRSYNQDELVETLFKYGFMCVYIEDFSFCQQVELMRNAEFIVGPSGAAWTNIIFASSEAKALCWMAEEWGDLSCFSNLASALNIDMQYLTYTAGTSDCRELYSCRYSISVEDVVQWVALNVDCNEAR